MFCRMLLLQFHVPFIHALFFLIIAPRLVAAIVRTVTIDDTFGDAVTGAKPVYSPPANWTKGQPCPLDECLVNPDLKQVWMGTWHDAVGTTDDTPPRTIDLTFQGNSISVYCIISQVDRVEIAGANMSFELDGEKVGHFFHDADGMMDAAGNYNIVYNALVYGNSSIPQGNHTLRISSIGYSRMLFDFANYTTDVDLVNPSSATAPPPSSTTHAGSERSTENGRPSLAIIVGAALGGSIAFLAIGVLGFVMIRRNRRSRNNHVYPINDFSKSADRRPDGKTSGDTQSYMSSSESVTLERPPTPFFPYTDTNSQASVYSQSSASRLHENSEQWSANPSPSDSIPLMEFPVPPSESPANQPRSRLVVSGEETYLLGPDNSIARFARHTAAEKEAELTRRMREMEAAIAAKQAREASASPAFGASASPSGPTRTDSVRSNGSASETALRGQVQELRTEIERMRMVQQQMALELRDATEPPPGYQ